MGLIPIAFRFVHTIHSLHIPLPKLQNPSHTSILKMKMLAMMLTLVAVLCTVGTRASSAIDDLQQQIDDLSRQLDQVGSDKALKKSLLKQKTKLTKQMIPLKKNTLIGLKKDLKHRNSNLGSPRGPSQP